MPRPSLCAVMLLAIVACAAPARREPVAPARVVANTPPPQTTDLDSDDILARTEVAPTAFVKHVLVAWAELERNYRGGLDPRAAKRTQAEAAALAADVAAKLRANPGAIDALMKEYSEDPGSLTLEPYTVETESPFVHGFKDLALRLKLEEVGVVKTTYGYHVMIRVPPAPPDPLESADILARPAAAGPHDVQHIVFGWQGLERARDPRARARTKPEADALATELLGKARAGDDMAALIKEYSEDPGTMDTAKAYTVLAESPFVEPFKRLALRLRLGETGLVKTEFGWHVVKRVPPPPPDPLESSAILQRTETADQVKVKHILLGWSEANAGDPRGEGRTRAALEKLVKTTLAKLAKRGAKIEPLMAELSEDPGSARSGESYEVTPDAAMVRSFVELSLRLKLNEVGVVKTEFGIHIIKRVE